MKDPKPAAHARTPEVGDRINYKLAPADLAAIAGRRVAFPTVFGGTPPVDLALNGVPSVAIVTSVTPGAPATDGRPAIPDRVNAQVMLDGNDTHFISGVVAGTSIGTWSPRDPA